MPYRYNAITGEFDLVQDLSTSGAVIQIDTDSGSVLPASGIVNLNGDITQGTSTSGVGDTATITVADATETQKGVVELATDAESIAGTDSTNLAIIPSSLAAKLGVQTQYGLAIGNTTSGALQWTGAGTDGQIPIAATGGNPIFASLTSSGGTISFTPGTNSLNLESGASVPTTFDADTGTATPALNVLILAGGDLLSSSAAGNTVTFDADDNVVGAVNTDSGLVTPTSHTFMIAGGNNCTTSGSADTVTIDVDGNVADSFPTDSGTATPALGVLTISGTSAQGLTTSGAGSTVTLTNSDATESQKGVSTFATDAEAIAGTVSDETIVPTSLKAKLGAQTSNGLPIGAGDTAAIAWTAEPADGELLIGATSATPALSTLTAGSGVSIVNAANSITISASGAGLAWSVETGATAAMVANQGVFANNGAGVAFTLPSTAAVGDTFEIVAMNAGGWTIAQNASQQIQIGNQTTTITTGTLASTAIGDWVQIVCNVANTNFICNVKQGNITVT